MKNLKIKNKINKMLNGIVAFLLLCNIIYLCVSFVTFNITLTGSMEPTFKVGQMQVEKYSNGKNLKRGTSIAFTYPYTSLGINNKVLGKRIIGLPGETVTINKDGVHINGKLLNEPYIAKDAKYDDINATFKVPKDCYFVMGDNRNHSLDSRYLTEPFVHQDWIFRITYACINKKGIKFDKGPSLLKEMNPEIKNF